MNRSNVRSSKQEEMISCTSTSSPRRHSLHSGGLSRAHAVLQSITLLLTAAICACGGLPYDEKTAKAFVELASGAYYCRTDACESWGCSSCEAHPMQGLVRLQDAQHDLNGFVGYDKAQKAIVVAFAGTDSHNMHNWISDLDAILTKYSECAGCLVHAGFWLAYKRLQPQVMKAVDLQRKANPKAPIWVTGHSMGAALAVHCVADLLVKGERVTASYNFGQPRVGNAEFAEWYMNITSGVVSGAQYRVTHNHDPVVHLPPQSFGFKHHAIEVFYDEDQGVYRVCDSSGEDLLCADQFALALSVDDHLNYLNVSMGLQELEGRRDVLRWGLGDAGRNVQDVERRRLRRG